MKKGENKDGAVSIYWSWGDGNSARQSIAENKTQITVWNRSPEEATSLLDDGAIEAKNVICVR